MRLVRFVDEQGQVRLGEQKQAEGPVVLEGDLYGELRQSGKRATVSQWLAPLRPTNIFCIGLNYRQHAEESGAEIPQRPVVFMKPTTSVLDPNMPIRLPRCCDPTGEVDYECELAVVIGKTARDVKASDALDFVLGYTAANDVSARKWQKSGGGGQWIRGKGFDTFCPLGPALVTRDEIPDPQRLRIRTRLNGEVVQDSTTADMIFTVAEIVSFLSQDTTLEPGTVILTGTPQGVGFARKPPLWLKDGDQLIVEIDGIGQLANSVSK